MDTNVSHNASASRSRYVIGSLSVVGMFDDENVRFYNKSRPFRFEAVWLRDESCEGIIRSAWNGGNSGGSVYRLMGKVEAC